MIPISKLSEVHTIVVHGDCPDGLASAIILDDALPGCKIVHAVHNQTLLEAVPGMLFCDFSPPPERAEEFRKVGTIVLDHHATAKSLVESFEFHAFGNETKDPGVSGAVLAYREVWLPLRGRQSDKMGDTVKEFAILAGIRDTWQKNSSFWGQACAQSEMLMFYPLSSWLGPEAPKYFALEAEGLRNERKKVGRISLAKQQEHGKKTLGKVFYETSAKGTKIAIFPTLGVSDVADQVRPDTQLIVGFGYTVANGEKKIIFSTRSRSAYNCSNLCTFYKGGGHSKAAGFTLVLPEGASEPYRMVRDLVDVFELSQQAP